MNIEGRKPSTPVGKDFRLDFWAWRPIHALIAQLCPDLIDKKTLEAMATGGGGGALDRESYSRRTRDDDAGDCDPPLAIGGDRGPVRP